MLAVTLLTAEQRRWHLVAGAALMLGLGLYWLWSDFVQAEPKRED